MFVAIALLSGTNPQFASNPPTQDSLFYYEIGGAEVVPRPLHPTNHSLNLDASARFGLGYSCGRFDPVLGVAETLNQVKSGAEDMLKAMTQAATGAIASLPALILQRANPGLYELMQNALVGAKLQVDLATKNCRQMEAEIAQGLNPYQELIVLSKGDDWKKQISLGGNSAIQAQNNVDEANGSNGLPWVFGHNAGGVNQPPLKLTSDVVQAGYNITLNRHVTHVTPAPTSVGGSLNQVWSTPQEASDWVVGVVGEQEVATCSSCTLAAMPGRGLLPQLASESETLTNQFDALLTSQLPPTRTDLAEVSGPNVLVTREVIDALLELSESEREIVLARLVNDIAVSRVLEKSFYARRLLLAGGQAPEVTGIQVAKDHVVAMVANLDDETERLLFEYRARQEVVSDTASALLQRAATLRNVARGIPEINASEDRPLVDGRIVR